MIKALDRAYEEIAELARLAALPTPYLPRPEREGTSDGLWLEEPTPGQFVMKYHEFGRANVYDVARGDHDRIVFEAIRSVVFDLAGKRELAHRRKGEDTRRQLFEIERDLMEDIRPGWGALVGARQAEILERHPYDDPCS